MIHFTRRRSFNAVSKLAFVILFVGLAIALVDSVWAMYLQSLLKNMTLVGYLSAIVTVIAILANFLLIPLLESKRSTTLFFLSLGAYAIIYCAYALNQNIIIFLILTILIIIANEILFESFGLLVRKESSDKKIGQDEGLILCFVNIGWLIGPLVSGYISAKFSFPSVFVLSAVFIMISLLFFWIFKIHETHRNIKHIDNNILKNLGAFFKEKELLKGYLVSIGIFYWWATIYIFMPLYMLSKNMSPFTVGVFLSCVVIPLVLFEYPVGKLIDKSKYKIIFSIGLLIPGICGLLAFISNNIIIILPLFVFASIGLSMLEPTRESYFFKIEKKPKRQARFYGPYKTGYYIGNVMGKIVPASIIIFLPANFVFLSSAAVMFSLIFVALTVKE